MSIVTMIHHDGYNNYNVKSVKQKQVMGPFDLDMCLEVFNSLEGEKLQLFEDLTGEDPVIFENVVTCMGEEGGFTFVYTE